MIELNEAAGAAGVGGGGIGKLFLGVEELEDALGGGDAGLDLLGHAAQLAERLVELAGVLDKRLGIAQCHLAVGHAQAAEDGDGDVGQVRDELHDRHHDAGEELGEGRGAEELLVALVELGGHGLGATEDLGKLVAGEGLLDLAIEQARGLPLRLELLLGAGADDADDDAGERQREQRDECEAPGDVEHHDGNAHHEQDVVEHLADRLLEGLLHVIHVVGSAREEVAALVGVEVVQRQAVDLGLDLLAQIVDDAHDQLVEP